MTCLTFRWRRTVIVILSTELLSALLLPLTCVSATIEDTLHSQSDMLQLVFQLLSDNAYSDSELNRKLVALFNSARPAGAWDVPDNPNVQNMMLQVAGLQDVVIAEEYALQR